MMLRGDWHAAVHELTLACEDLTRGYGQLVIGHAYYELGEMYRLMGDSRAEEFYRRASDNGASTQPGLALLRLSQGQIEAAVNSIRRALAETEAPLDRLALLPAYVHIMIEADHIDAARDGLAELERISKTYDAPAVQAQVSHASGAVRLAEGSPADALPQLRLAARLWRELDAPYETACAAVLIGIACRLLSDDEAASMELDWAKSTFAKLGARPDLDRLAMIIDARSNVHGLSNRDVLRRVAEGKTNRVIASELFVSERTVHRHVSNIFDKLGVNSRTAAAAYAIEHRLVAPGTSQA
jgi:DNA-binding CsgD family transcriptional regulator